MDSRLQHRQPEPFIAAFDVIRHEQESPWYGRPTEQDLTVPTWKLAVLCEYDCYKYLGLKFGREADVMLAINALLAAELQCAEDLLTAGKEKVHQIILDAMAW